MKIWKFKRFAFGVQVPSMLCLYQKFTVCWVFPRKDLYESIRRPFLQGTSIMKVYVLCVYMRYMYLVTQSCPTLWDPMDHSLPGSSVRGILQARILEWVATSYSRGSSRPRDRNCVSRVSCVGRRISLPVPPPGKPMCVYACMSLPSRKGQHFCQL